MPFFPHIGKEVQFRLFSSTSKVFEKDNASNIISTTTKMIYNLHRLFLFISPLLPSQTDTQNHLKILLPFLDDSALEDGDDLNLNENHGDHDEQEYHDGATKLQLLHSKPSVSFDKNVKQDNHHYPLLTQQQHNDNDDDAPHADDNDDDNDDDARPQLHGNAPSQSDQPPAPTSAKFQNPAQMEPILSRTKYNLRPNPPRNQKYFQ